MIIPRDGILSLGMSLAKLHASKGGDRVKLTALSLDNKFLLKNMNLFRTKRIQQQVKIRQEVKW